MNASDRLSIASAVAALASGVSLFPLTEDRSYLALSFLLIGMSVLIGGGLRRSPVSKPVVRAAQFLPVLVLPLLIPSAGEPFALFRRTYEFAYATVPPMPYEPGFAALSAAMVWGIYWLAEVLADDLASPAWTFPVLILPFGIPSVAIFPETSPALFCLSAAGYSLVLATATAEALAPRPGEWSGTTRGWRSRLAATAGLATIIAFTAAVAIPIPERTTDSPQPGGSGSVQLGDPSLDLIRNVNSTSDQVVISYTTSDGRGQYLRQAALPVFDERGFHLTATDLVPMPIGQAPPRSAGPTVQSKSTIGNLAGEYLPTPWFPISQSVPDASWRYDPKTLAVVAVGPERTTATRNLSYQTVSARSPDAERLLTDLAGAGNPGDDGLTLELPGGMSPEIRVLAEELTADETLNGNKALALLRFLRSDQFTYSTAVIPGTTLGTLDDFLLGNRIGYCEQFAASLAVLARAIGIPSRVVVGFLPGRKTDGGWVVTPKNMHAWTELYFGGNVGWVAVDPTPSGASGSSTPSAPTTPLPSATSRQPETVPTSQQPTLSPAPAANAGDHPEDRVPLMAGAAVCVALLTAGPRLTRAGLRRFRLAGSPDPRKAAEKAWTEVEAVAADRAHSWPAGTSRQVATLLGPELGTPGSEALWGLAIAVERARYDSEPASSAELAELTGVVTSAMNERWRTNAAKSWWPRSMWPTRRPNQRI